MDIVFQKITSTPTGVGATSGKNTENAFNGNFDAVKENLEMLFNVVSAQVSSQNITQLRVDTSTTPYSLYYTLDPLSEESPLWYQLSSTFASLIGEPSDNIALSSALLSKADKGIVDGLDILVQNHSNDLDDLQTDFSTVRDLAETASADVANIQYDIGSSVRTEQGDKLWMRFNPSLSTVEYSTDGLTWQNVLTAGITFADITGDPADNLDLALYVINLISISLGDYALKSSLLSHTMDKENPHNVTRDQLGLVDVLDDIAYLKGVVGQIETVNIESYINNEFEGSDLFYISSHYPIEEEEE